MANLMINNDEYSTAILTSNIIPYLHYDESIPNFSYTTNTLNIFLSNGETFKFSEKSNTYSFEATIPKEENQSKKFFDIFLNLIDYKLTIKFLSSDIKHDLKIDQTFNLGSLKVLKEENQLKIVFNKYSKEELENFKQIKIF